MRDINIGRLLRKKRVEYGWSAETAGVLYGNAVRGRPVTEGAIHTLEEGTIPKNIKRRWVLARMYNLTPVMLGLPVLQKTIKKIPYMPSRKTQPVSVEEYQDTLLSYWKLGYSGTAEAALKDLGYRINCLHDNVLYTNSIQKEQMKQLLCGYHMRRAEVARELSYNASALDHLNKAVILAREEKYSALEATALYRRGEFFFDSWDFQVALKDFGRALALERFSVDGANVIPPQVKGRILNVQGLTEARIARTRVEMAEAMKLVDKSEQFIGPEVEDDIYALDLTDVRYLLNRAKALVGPPKKELHQSVEAFDVNKEMLKHSNTEHKRFHAYHIMDGHIIEALYYIDKGYYPIATALVQEALTMMEEMNSTIHLPITIHVYEDLKGSPYGKSVEVAELGLHLLFIQHPDLSD